MNALNVSFGFTITSGARQFLVREGLHFRMYPTGKNRNFGEELGRHQIDLLRIGMAVHLADSWIRRSRSTNGLRQPVLDIEVLDAAFWAQADTYVRLKECVDFLSGGDDWSFSFHTTPNTRHDYRPDLFRGRGLSALVALYSGGLDSAAGLAVRLATAQGRVVVPVTVRHQMHKGRLVHEHFNRLIEAGLASKMDMKPFQVGAFIKNARLKSDFGLRIRETSHRCRPFLFMCVAGLVANSLSSREVEIFESGVGSVNLPLISGVPDFRTTRSTHPHFLRLISNLVSHVNEDCVHFVLPFASRTKAEIVRQAKELGMEELLRKSISCILHPLRRSSGRQCGHCPACVYRRQAMINGGIDEDRDAYDIDLFSPSSTLHDIPEKLLKPIQAFHQQAARLAELDTGRVPYVFRKYLYATKVVSSDEELAPHVEVYRRYRREWVRLVSDARRRGLPWIANDSSRAHALSYGVEAEGANP